MIYNAVIKFGMQALNAWETTSVNANNREEAIERIYSIYPETVELLLEEREQSKEVNVTSLEYSL